MSDDRADDSQARRIRHTAERLMHIVATGPTVLYTAQRSGASFELNWVAANISSLLGLDAEQVICDGGWYSLLDPSDRTRMEDVLAKLDRHEAFVEEYAVRTADGRSRWVQEQGRLVPSDDGTGPELIGSLADVTDRRELESQLRHSQKLEAVGRLAGGVAHDFNNLLGVITMFGTLMQRKLAADNPLQRNTQEILKAADRAATLTRQLLAFSRLQSLTPRLIDLAAVIRDVEKLLRRLLGEDVTLETRLPDQPLWIDADPGAVEQILVSLAVNARDAMPKGGRLTIEGSVCDLDETDARHRIGRGRGSFVRLAIADTGSGMSEEVRARAFEPYFSTKAGSKASGLGLSTVYGIVKQSGGEISVESQLNLGTEFTILFPTAAAPVTSSQDSALARSASASATVLLAEDEPALREAIAEALEAAGYRVLAAESGKAALALAATTREPIDLLVSDIVMPGVSGLELADRLRAAGRSLPVVFISGYGDEEIASRGLGGSDLAVLAKPFTPEALCRRVQDELSRVPRRGN